MHKSILFLFAFVLFFFSGFSQVKKNINRAESALYKGRYEEAKKYYLTALAKDRNNYKANLGLGTMMVYWMEDHEHCLPYLEKALSVSVNDTVPELIFALGRTYHYFGRYNRALDFYIPMLRYNEPGNPYYERELNKHIADCHYAMENTTVCDASRLFVINAGRNINTSMQEYVPVPVGNEKLIFTSKRKDHKKEKINKDNGKYYESMYYSELQNGYPSAPVRFSIPELTSNTKSYKSNESMISLLPGGKKAYVYRNQKLYEADLESTASIPDKISKVINFDYYQNHAYLSEEDRVLYFTSESAEGFGGNDIYRSQKLPEGNWTAPESIGSPINTPFDEEAPFISSDGKTLFFSSKGLPGYGGFDIYVSTFENGTWSIPKNLGQPLNSPADDIFYAENSDGTCAYMSSSRKGGQGDMDIYKVNYTERLPKDCNTYIADWFPLDLEKDSTNRMHYRISTPVPSAFYKQLISYEVTIDDSLIRSPGTRIDYIFMNEGVHLISAKMVAWCDTCPNLVVACSEKKLNISPQPETLQPVTAPVDTVVPSVSKCGEKYEGKYAANELSSLGFDGSVLYFDYNTAELRADVRVLLDKNAEVLKKYPALRLIINGYTDSKGTEAYNVRLSESRAASVRRYLRSKGLRNLVEISGKGEKCLVNDCTDDNQCSETEHGLNRRVEIRILKETR